MWSVRQVRLCIVLLALPLSEYSQVAPSPWPKEPTGFIGIKFGSTESQARAVRNIQRCLDGPSYRTCILIVPFGDFNATVFLMFDNGKFASAEGTFPAERFSDMRDRFIETYGRPQSSSSAETVGWLGHTAMVVLGVGRVGTTGPLRGLGKFSVGTIEFGNKLTRDRKAPQ